MGEAEDEFVEAARQLGIIGMDPHCDAVKQPLYDGIRIWYLRDGVIRWVSRTRDHQHRWNSPVDTDRESLVDSVSASDSFDVIDARLHNLLASGPLEDTVHEGISWGVVLMFGSQLRKGKVPMQRSLESIPGVGEKTARKISSRLRSYPSELYRPVEERSPNASMGDPDE